MSEFVESEAVEDDEEDEDVEGGDRPRRSKDGDEYEDSSEEDETQPNEYEQDGFVVDDAEDDEDVPSKRIKKKRKRQKHEEAEFEEGDLQLLEEAGFRMKKKNRLRRLRKHHSDDEEEEEDRDEDEEEEERRGPDENIDYDEDEDNMDNFIEDDEGSRRRRRGGADGVSSAAMEEAREIFGDQDEVEDYQGLHVLVASDAEDSDTEPMQRLPEENEDEEDVELDDIKKLTIKMDPGLADERFFTARDEEIRSTDMPEALQEHFGRRKRSAKEDLGEEAAWIYRCAFLTNPMYDTIDREALIEKIAVTLAFIHVKTFDIPFVAIYRKEYVMDDLMLRSDFDDFGDWSGLWTVLEWDKRWAHMSERRERAIKMAENAMETKAEVRKVQTLLSNARTVSSEPELADIESHLQLLAEQAAAGMSASADDDAAVTKSDRRRRPNRRDRYRSLYRIGVMELAKKFGISASQLAENLQRYQAIHRPEDPSVEPQDAAISWATGSATTNLDDPAKCLAAARYMLCAEIVAEEDIIRHVRSVFKVSAMVSTTPTTKARNDVDDTHPLRPFCTVQNKPTSLLLRERSGDFVMMQQAEEEGLATIDISMRENDYNELVDDIHRFYLSQNLSATAIAWNEQRRLIVKAALNKILEILKREMRRELADDGQSKLKASLTRGMEEVLHQGPARFDSLDCAPRVLAVSVTSREEDEDGEQEPAMTGGVSHKRYVGNAPMVTFVMLDKDGEVVESTEVSGGWLRRKKDDPVPVDISNVLWKNVIHHFQPNCIVIGIGSGGKDTLRLKSDIIALLGDNVRRVDAGYLGVRAGDLREHEDLEHRISSRVILVPDETAVTFARTKLAVASLAEMTFLQRRCVGLGRLAQEPLTVYAAISSEKYPSSSSSYSKFGHLLTPGNRREAIRRAMVRAVCTVGFDLNRAMIHAHMRPMLQFVSGLGVRKAEALFQAIEKSGDPVLRNRESLQEKFFLERNVFYSASGFLRIRHPDLAAGDATATSIRKRIKRDKKKKMDFAHYEPLEDSRMHPENYNVAIKIAEQSVEETQKKSKPLIVMEVMEYPTLLDALDLDQYAQDLEAKGHGKNHETVRLIVEEFQEPYRDARRKLKDPSEKMIFKAVTGMDPDTQLFIGALVTATDCRPISSGKGINCSVGGTVRGFIHKNDLSDQKLTEEDVVAKVIAGSSISCRVLEVTLSAFEIKLACRASVLNNPNSIYGYNEPEFYDNYCLRYEDLADEKADEDKVLSREQQGLAKEKMLLQQRKDRLTRRSTKHQFWKDVSMEEAERLMADAPVGEIIIRPGSTRKSISFTYKLFDGVVAHFKVNEEREMKNGVVTSIVYVEASATGAGERFSDLDEVVARVLEPIITNYNEAVNYRKFRDVVWTELQAILREEKRRNPATIPYLFIPDRRRERVGSFILGFLPGRNTVARATIIVNADGFKLRNVLHPKLSALFDWFKKNYQTLDGPGTAPVPPPPVSAPPPPPPPPPPEDYPRGGAPPMNSRGMIV